MSNGLRVGTTVTSNDEATWAPSGSLAVTVTSATPGATPPIVSVASETTTSTTAELDEVAV